MQNVKLSRQIKRWQARGRGREVQDTVLQGFIGVENVEAAFYQVGRGFFFFKKARDT